jgi:hypothetical protein
MTALALVRASTILDIYFLPLHEASRSRFVQQDPCSPDCRELGLAMWEPTRLGAYFALPYGTTSTLLLSCDYLQ